MMRALACALVVLAYPMRLLADEAGDREALRQRLTEREDKRRPAAPFGIDLAGRPLTIGGEFAFDADELRAPATSAARRSSGLRREAIELELYYDAAQALIAFAQLRLIVERERNPDGELRASRFVEPGELWLHATEVGGLPLTLDVGRLKFEDERRWRWDTELDGLRAIVDAGAFEGTLALTRELGGQHGDRREAVAPHRRATRAIAQLGWRSGTALGVELYALRQRERPGPRPASSDEAAGARLLWLGATVQGRLRLRDTGRIDYGFDAARLRGSELPPASSDGHFGPRRSVRGWGFDSTLRWTLAAERAPRLFAGYAWGSGKPPAADGSERTFRQTGLQANEAGFGAVKRYPHYGALLDPELSNLRIATVGGGLSLFESSSLDLLLHRYTQVAPATALRNARLEPELNGARHGIGSAIEAVLAIEEWQRFEWSLIGSAFRAGPAFGPLAGKWYRYGALEARLAF